LAASGLTFISLSKKPPKSQSQWAGTFFPRKIPSAGTFVPRGGTFFPAGGKFLGKSIVWPMRKTVMAEKNTAIAGLLRFFIIPQTAKLLKICNFAISKVRHFVLHKSYFLYYCSWISAHSMKKGNMVVSRTAACWHVVTPNYVLRS
jgi:hypothetical protein